MEEVSDFEKRFIKETGMTPMEVLRCAERYRMALEAVILINNGGHFDTIKTIQNIAREAIRED